VRVSRSDAPLRGPGDFLVLVGLLACLVAGGPGGAYLSLSLGVV
jgi:hypothetical protein